MKIIHKEENHACSECRMVAQNLIKFKNDSICLDCLDKALKTLIHKPWEIQIEPWRINFSDDH